MSYTWVTGGFDQLGTPTLNSDVITSLDLPPNAVLKKILVRQTWVGLFCSGLDHTAVQPSYLSLDVRLAGGLHDGRILYQADRDIPFEANSFVATAVDVYSCWWHAADEQLGLNQRMSYAMGVGGAEVNFTCAINTLATPFTPPTGDWHMGFAALYKL